MTRTSISAADMVTPAIKKGVGRMHFVQASQSANALSGRVVDRIGGD